MVMMKQIAFFALVGTALALPHRHRGDYNGPYTRWDTNFGGDKSGYVGTPTSETVAVTTEVIVIPAGNGGHHHHEESSSDTPTYSSPEPATSPSTGDDSGSGSTTPSTGSETGYMAVVSKWRSAGGLEALTQSSKLEANALKTAQDGHGKMQHELNPGSMAQVLAPGTASGFEKVYVGGWLCEDPSLPGLSGTCASMTSGWDHSNGEKGHAEILTSKSYSNIGCALANGIWACDLS